MPFLDSRDISAGGTVDADVCIVGSGPAGLAIAFALADAGRRVLVLEAGEARAPVAIGTDALDSRGHPPGDVFPLHHEGFGGTLWYGRCVRLDPIDFETRPWMPGSGWPICRSEVERHYAAAARFLGVPRPESLQRPFWAAEPAARLLQGGGLDLSVHVFAPDADLGRCYRHAVGRTSRLRVAVRAPVTSVQVDEAGQAVSGLRVARHGGGELQARAAHYVLACGGLENTRLLLMAARARPGLFGESESILGRGYMNHVRMEAVGRLRLHPRHPAYRRLFAGLTKQRSARAGCHVQLAARLDEDVQRRERLANAMAFFYGASAPGLAALGRDVDRLRQAVRSRRFEAGDLTRAGRLVLHAPALARAAWARAARAPYRIDHLVLVDQIEQAAAEESVVSLGDERDAVGRPRLCLTWRVGPEPVRAARRLHELLAARVEGHGVGTLESRLLEDPACEPAWTDARHPMGTTRMSADPRAGIVDPHLRVHALSNLFVAGSSVFPAGGAANPTLAIVALSLRLADRLRGLA